MELQKTVDIAIDYLGKDYFAHLQLFFAENGEKNYLRVNRHGKEVHIFYGCLSNLFRGLSLVKEKKLEQDYDISLKKKIDTNGLMLDCSRNGVMKVEKVKETILISALMGHNRLLLYTEDTYELDNFPYFGYLRGRYTKEELKEMVEYGEAFGVELVPCIQTLGHMHQVLKWQPMDHLRDGMGNLLVDYEPTYVFIENMIKTCRECFKSKNIHIGMDEVWEMGLDRYLKKFGFKDRVAMFSRHLDRVVSICKKYDFFPMIWSDMYFRFGNKDEEYCRVTPLPETTIKLVPHDVSLVYWDYYHEDIGTYLRMIQYHKQIGNPVIFAGGSWKWKGFCPSIKVSMDYTKEALNACEQESVNDIFITAWGDDGNECSFFSSLPVLAETSVMSFESYDLNKIDSLLKAVTGDSLEMFLLMDSPDNPLGKKLHPSYNPSKFLFYQDVLLGYFDSQVKNGFKEKYCELKELLARSASKSQRYGYIFDNLSKLCGVLAIKVDLGIRLRKAYKSNDKAMMNEILDDFKPLLEALEKFQMTNEAQWLTECKPFGYEVLDGRLGFLKNRIISAHKRIKKYLDGEIDKIEELEQEILPYNGIDCEMQCNSWHKIVSASNS